MRQTSGFIKPANGTNLPERLPNTNNQAGTPSNQSIELVPLGQQPFSAFGSLHQFKDARRMAVMLAQASIVPETYRGEGHIGDCVLALEIANRIGASVLAVMQNLCLVEGRLGWSTQFLISCVNATRRFSSIRYQMTGTRGQDNWGCIAWAIDRTGERLNSPEVTIKMAKEEGWYYRTGSKWRTMPELMLCYRSATLFTRLYAPEITMGIQTAEEMADLGLGKGSPVRPVFEIAGPKPRGQTKGRSKKPPQIHAKNQPNAGAAEEKKRPRTSKISAESVADPRPPPATLSASVDGPYDYLKALTGLIALSKHSETDVLRFLCNTRRCDTSCANLGEVAQKHLHAIIWTHDNWQALDRELTHLKRAVV